MSPTMSPAATTSAAGRQGGAATSAAPAGEPLQGACPSSACLGAAETGDCAAGSPGAAQRAQGTQPCQGLPGAGSQAATRSGPGSRGPARSSWAGRNRLSGCEQVLGAAASPALNADRSPVERLEDVTRGRSTCSPWPAQPPPVPAHAPAGRASSSQLSQEGPRACQGTEPRGPTTLEPKRPPPLTLTVSCSASQGRAPAVFALMEQEQGLREPRENHPLLPAPVRPGRQPMPLAVRKDPKWPSACSGHLASPRRPPHRA